MLCLDASCDVHRNPWGLPKKTFNPKMGGVFMKTAVMSCHPKSFLVGEVGKFPLLNKLKLDVSPV